MSMTILLIVQILLALALIALILIQRGRGADTGAAFGSGASTTVFGARGSASFLTRATSILAILFFANCFVLSYFAGRTVEQKSLMEEISTTGAVGKDAGKAEETSTKVESEVPSPAGTGTGEVPAVNADASSEVPTVGSAPAPVESPSAPKD